MCVRACHLSPLSQSADRVSERFSLYARSLEAEALHPTRWGWQEVNSEWAQGKRFKRESVIRLFKHRNSFPLPLCLCWLFVVVWGLERRHALRVCVPRRRRRLPSCELKKLRRGCSLTLNVLDREHYKANGGGWFWKPLRHLSRNSVKQLGCC